MKRLLNEKGSTLMLILITTAILTMLGTALLAMSLMNVTMKANDKRITSTVYLAESGIDQVYARVGSYVEKAIEYAITETDVDMQVLLADLDLIINYIDPLTGFVDPTKHPDYLLVGSVYLNNDDYSLNVTELESYSDDLYKEFFKEFLDDLEDSPDPNNLSYILGTQTYISLLSDGVSTLSISVGDVQKFSDSAGDDEFIIRNVRSEFLLMGETLKVVTTDIVVTDEITSYPLNTLENRIAVKDNPLWQQALVANENIHVKGNGELNVIGNVYGYGLLPASIIAGGRSQDAEPVDYGGIIFDGTSDTVINGNIYSRNYVQLAEASSATVVVNDGAIYANTVIAQKDSNGSMTVNGNVYTIDDLEHNGDNADIIINGSYYGYADGSVGVTHDTSSAIVINADTSLTSSMSPTLTITGNAPYADYNPVSDLAVPKTRVHKESDSGVMVGGTGYIDRIIDPINNTRYQMAESIAFKENALAYTWAFSSTLIDTLIADASQPYVAGGTNKFGFYPDDATQDDHLSKFLNKDNVSWHSVTPTVNLAAGYNSGTPSDSSDDVYAELSDRKAIFATFQNEVDTSGAFVNKGTGHVTISNYIYTTGLQLVSGKFEIDNASQPTFDALRLKINDDYLYQLHKLEPRDGIDFTYLYDTGSGLVEMIDYSILESVNGDQDPTVANANAVMKYSNIDALNIRDFNVDIDATTNIAELYNISDASGEDLTIYGGSGTNSINALYMNGVSKIQGIVLRTGNVTIEGDVVFEGPIITNKSIYIEDGASLTIQNESFDFNEDTKEMLARLIFEFDDLYNVFNVTNYYSSGDADPVSLDEVEYSTIDFSGSTYDSNHNSVFTYYDWIHFNHWKVAE